MSADIIFTLKTDFIELYKLLKFLNLCDTGGMAKLAIAHGQAKVDGTVETRKACKIRAGQVVMFGEQIINIVKETP